MAEEKTMQDPFPEVTKAAEELKSKRNFNTAWFMSGITDQEAAETAGVDQALCNTPAINDLIIEKYYQSNIRDLQRAGMTPNNAKRYASKQKNDAKKLSNMLIKNNYG